MGKDKKKSKAAKTRRKQESALAAAWGEAVAQSFSDLKTIIDQKFSAQAEAGSAMTDGFRASVYTGSVLEVALNFDAPVEPVFAEYKRLDEVQYALHEVFKLLAAGLNQAGFQADADMERHIQEAHIKMRQAIRQALPDADFSVETPENT